MTGTASQQFTAVTALMPYESKAELIMREFHQRCLSQASGPSLVIWMTRGALLWIDQGTVQSLRARHLIPYVRMAIRAEKGIRPAKGRMTPAALRFEIRMRCHAGNRTTQRMFRAERAWAK